MYCKNNKYNLKVRSTSVAFNIPVSFSMENAYICISKTYSYMKNTLTILAGIVLTTSAYAGTVPTISQADKERAAGIVSQMTLEEKCLLLSGKRDSFFTYPVERLGVPEVNMADGPQGVRNYGSTRVNSTYYPCGIAIAASFNREVAKGVGTGIGNDAKSRGVGIMLCPGVNIYRSPLCGRNFEYMGEDPYLASETAANYITGIQEQGVMSTIKHFAINNQEYDRHKVSSNIDERTANEIYFPTFRKAVEQAKVAAVMTSYNPINGVHAAENPWLIKENLRKWGFEGIVMSDWTSTYSTLCCAFSGLDLEMPKGYAMNPENLIPLIENGVVPMSEIDEKCQHIIQSFIAYGYLDKPMKDTSIPEDNETSRAFAYQAAIEAPVLLKNENGALPLLKGGRILLVGPNADCIPYGGGSGAMYPYKKYEITLYQALKDLGGKFKVELRNNIPSNEEELKNINTIICAVGFNSSTEKENSDRKYAFDDKQIKMIKAAAESGKKVIVVVYSGGEVDFSGWADSVDAIIMGWYSGQEGGKALADIIAGKVSPSGRLPFTFWGSLEKNPSTPHYQVKYLDSEKYYKGNAARYRADRHGSYPYAEYAEGIFVGYRGISKFGSQPLYPFGYGLTYSSFEYSGLEVSAIDTESVSVSFTVKNTGKFEASEVAQVYVAPKNPSIIRPERELKEYAKVKLAPGASQAVTLTLPASAFSYYDVTSHDWVVDHVSYMVEVGASALDIKLSAPLSL